VKVELVWVDNHSTDQTFETLKAYPFKRLPWLKGVRLVRLKKNRFISGAVNAALKLAKGRFFLQADNDVLFAPEALRLYAAACFKHPRALLSPCWLYTQRLLGRNFYPACLENLDLAFGRLRRAASFFRPEWGIAAGSCWAADTRLVRDAGGWDEGYRVICMDDDFHWRWLKKGLPLALLPLAVYHPGERTRVYVTGAHPLAESDIRRLKEEWGGSPWTRSPRQVPWQNKFLGHQRVARWLGRFLV
jgi:GT2 family glycosyltransferase